jgi:cyclo(L-tyrosyl-L-tyrosyl) synthase
MHATDGAEPTEEQIDHAVDYALAELPLVVNGPAVFNTETSLFVYHRPMDLLKPLITGEATALHRAEGQGYAVVTFDETAATGESR